MRTKLVIISVLSSMLLLTVSAENNHAPRIDGVISTGEWETAKTGLLQHKQTDNEGRFHYWIHSDANRLYFAVRRKVQGELSDSRSGRDDPNLWQDDTVELFISPHYGSSSYYQLLFNPKGVSGDTYYHKEKHYPQWNPPLQKASKVKDGFWTLEGAVNLKDFNCTRSLGSRWGFNIISHETAGKRNWSIVPLDGTAHNPEIFSPLELKQAEKVAVAANQLSALFSPINGVSLAIPACGEKPTIDGRIGASEWDNALSTNLRTKDSKTPSPNGRCISGMGPAAKGGSVMVLLNGNL